MELLSALGLFALIFGLSMGVSYVVTSWRGRHVEKVNIEPNSKVRLIGPGGAYRCYFIKSTDKGLIFTSPLHKDSFVPVRAGESLMVQVPTADGLLTFSSTVVSRDAESHELLLSHPTAVRRTDRRAEPRDTAYRGTTVKVNGEQAELIDLSAGGAKIVGSGSIRPGDAIEVQLPTGLGQADGWALECLPASFGTRQGSEVRICFDHPLAGLRSPRVNRF